MEKVSVIIPIYNVEKYLSECLDSVVNQTYKNLEIILINDGSKDGSANICKEYAEKDSRIIFIDQENIGVSKTRNKGIDIATGKYVLFVDSDDYCEANMVETAVKNYDNEKMFVWGYTEVYKDKIVPIKYDEITMKNLHQYINTTTIGSSCNKIFLTEILKNQKIRFEEKIYNCEDLLFVLTYLKYVKEIKYDATSLYHHRIGKNIIMFFKKPNERNVTILKAYEKILEIPDLSNELINKIKYEYIVTFYRIRKFLPKNFEIDKDILMASKRILISREYSLKEKIRYVIIKYFNSIYKKYYLRKIDENNLFD